MTLYLTRPSSRRIDELLDAARTAATTYSEIGATHSQQLPAGYRQDRYDRTLGAGAVVFEAAVAALHAWQAHRGAGVDVLPAEAQLADGETFLLLLRASGLWTAAPCRIVYMLDEPERFGFGYGTLPGHPEEGEASFTVELDDGSVSFRITSFSRTVDPLARAVSPLTRIVQQRVTRSYLKALAEAVQASVRGS